MKRILIVCLLGMGLLLPYNKITAKEFSEKEISKRIVDIMLEGNVLIASSDASTGTINEVKIYNSSKQKVVDQTCYGGYVCDVDVSGLPSGFYTAQVFTTMTVYSENFAK